MTTPAFFSPDAIEQLTMASDPWLSCDDCFDQIDQLIEETLTHRGAGSDALRVHLRACTVCRDEAYSLAMLAAPDYDIDPARASATLDRILSGDSQARD